MGINIGIDADGVIFDTEAFQLSPKVKKYVKKHYNLEVINENAYGIKDVYGCDKRTEIDIWSRFIFEYSLKFKPRLWMNDTITKLRREGHKVYIITSKACALEKSFRGFVVRSLFELGLKIQGIRIDGIEYCSLEKSEEDKLRACKQKKIDVMVEDKWENIEELSKDLYVLCMDTKNNSGKVFNQNVVRVYDANDIYVHIQKTIEIITGATRVVNKYQVKNKDQKRNMEASERKKYYAWLKTYYGLLPFSVKQVNHAERVLRILAKGYSLYFWCKYRPVIVGKENLLKEKGVIYICNHLCNKDMLFLLYAFHDASTQWHPLIKREILNEKTGVLFKEAYSVFVDRKSQKDRHIATQELAKLLVNGYNVLIFPEGTYNKTQNNLKNFEGVSHVYLSSVLGKKIIPCALTSDYHSRPVLSIGEAYLVGSNVSIEEALKESYGKLDQLVEQNKRLVENR